MVYPYMMGLELTPVGEYSVEIIPLVAACLAHGMRVDKASKPQLAYPPFSDAVEMAAQKLVRELRLSPLPQLESNMKSPPVYQARVRRSLTRSQATPFYPQRGIAF